MKTKTETAPPATPARTVIDLRAYQTPIFNERGPGVIIIHWARQIGKSFTLAAWAVDRLLERGKEGRLVTVLSNSRENGAEFLLKCAEVCRILGQKFQMEETSPNVPFQQMRMEIRIRRKGKIGRIKVLAANPRTARGFSGDLILDEFAFHENSAAIWEAAEPILASNPDFRCRIASTGNGKHNLFYRMASGWSAAVPSRSGEDNARVSATPEDGDCSEEKGKSGAEARAVQTLTRQAEHAEHPKATGISDVAAAEDSRAPGPNNNGELFISAAGFAVSRVTRTAAWQQGVKIYDLKNKRESITPEAARAQALDKTAYDQNYECAFADENMTLLTHELISAAQNDVVTIDAQEWSQASIARMQAAQGRLEVGNDIGRNRDLSMVTVIDHVGPLRRVVAMLKLENMRLPDQQRQLATVCRMPKFHAYCGDMTGLGLGLVEFLQDLFGRYRIHGVNFSATERASSRIQLEGRKAETARVTEIMAVNLLACFEDRTIRDLPNDPALTDDLRKPEKITSPGGRVSIAATRDEAGHADAFWSLALAVRAGEVSGGGFAYEHVDLKNRFLRGPRRKGVIA